MEIRIADGEQLPDVLELLASRGWAEGFDPGRGDVYVAWDDAVVACLQVIEIDEETTVLDVVLVDEVRRRQGIGAALVTAATVNRAGVIYVSCRDDAVPFYESLGFTMLTGGLGAAPSSVNDYWREVGNRAPLAMVRAGSRRGRSSGT